MNFYRYLAILIFSLLTPAAAFAHAGHLDTIEHAVLHMLEHNGREIGLVILVIVVILVGFYFSSVKKNVICSKDKK